MTVPSQTFQRFLCRSSHIVLLLVGCLSLPVSANLKATDVFGLPLEDLLAIRLTTEARKHPENVQTIPVSVTSFSGQLLEYRQLDSISELGAHVPSMSSSFSSGYAGNPRIFMRGLGQNETSMPTAESAVGLYLDDVYLARSNAANFFLHDIERVEVLRGPQGALYGRNTTTGAIKIISRQPSATPYASLRARYGSNQHQDYSLVLNGPLGKSGINARASLLFSDEQGDVSRYSDSGQKLEDDLGDRRHSGGQLALQYDLSSGIQMALKAYRYEDSSDAIYAAPIDADGNVISNGGLRSTLSSKTQFSSMDQNGLSLQVSGASQLGQWKSTSAYRRIKDLQFNDISGQDIWYINGDIRTEQISQEFQLSQFETDSKLNWVIGLYLLHEDNQANVFNDISQQNFTSRQIYDLQTNSAALYGVLTYHLHDKTELALGGRYTRDEKDFDGSTSNTGGLWTDGEAVLSRRFSHFSPKVSLSHKLSTSALIYLSASEGFKAGGFQGRAFNGADLQQTFGPEVVSSYELGYKASFLDNKLRLASNYFYNDYRDLQLNTFNAASGGTTIQNAGEARLHGFELELDYISSIGLNLYAHWSAAWDRYEALDKNINNVTLDSEFPETPRGSSLAGFDYQFEHQAGGTVSFGANYQYHSSVHPGAANAESTKIPPLELLNAFVKYEPANARWSIGLAAKNLADKDYHYTGFALPVFQSKYAAPGRQLLFSLGFEF